ncbi:hypothetical protein Ssi02_34400 [Sinosporangium siamense]|uniref:Uncharacterized protein n=1 Tax=Sinosporangium siamense TaxID=1367973 RepID=A0A919RIX7_9ACTN|nr:hypothetical protein Ssi02_34400 [Sinosporangium siamense]
MSPARSTESLDDGTEESALAARRLDYSHRGKVSIGGIAHKIEHEINHPPASENLAILPRAPWWVRWMRKV